MKQIVNMISVFVFSVFLVACSNKEESTATPAAPASTTPAVAPAPTDAPSKPEEKK